MIKQPAFVVAGILKTHGLAIAVTAPIYSYLYKRHNIEIIIKVITDYILIRMQLHATLQYVIINI